MRYLLLLLFIVITSCGISKNSDELELDNIILGSERLSKYLPLLEGKKVGIVTNHTSLIKNTHLVDTLLSLNVHIEKIFSPEHGFRGEIEAGELIDNQIDIKTKLPVISLYGSRNQPWLIFKV